MEINTVGVVLAIVVITYLVGLAAKAIPAVKNEMIPVIVGVAGGILGAVGMYVIPDYPANDLMNAIAIGISSGLASTGINQAYKQLFTKDESYEEEL